MFALQALEKGAKCAVVDNPDLKPHDRCIVVHDTLATLQEMAGMHRARFDIPVLAITGSNGKTTTKELTARVLEKKYRLISTQGNLNNHIGVPLTVLKINDETELAVIEMGANHIGEIASLCRIAKPGYGIITNIGRAHLEGFGGYEGVIKAKSELYEYIRSEGGLVFVSRDQSLLTGLSEGMNRILYGKSEDSEVNGMILQDFPELTISWKSGNDEGTLRSHLFGSYNFENIMAAISAGLYFKVDKNLIREAVEDYRPDNMRSQLVMTRKNTLFLDAYNANPSSMEAAIRHFASVQAEKKMIILGDMLELGEDSAAEHHKILDLLMNTGFLDVILIGPEFGIAARDFNYQMFSGIDDAYKWFSLNQPEGYSILIKGSRRMKLEKLVSLL
jgi:UDP-N-acetylmuramoyl-tripeptide--D-alanyl-D-alanine ligase